MAVANAAAEAEAAAANAAAEGPARAMAGKAVPAEAAERWIRPQRQTCGHRGGRRVTRWAVGGVV